jgi:hypothetical protein
MAEAVCGIKRLNRFGSGMQPDRGGAIPGVGPASEAYAILFAVPEVGIE